MAKKEKLSNKKRKAGLPPGSLVYTGTRESVGELEMINYNLNSVQISKESEVSVLMKKITPEKQTWIRVIGLNQIEDIQKIGEAFKINKMLLEDILDVSQRPKSESFQNIDFFTLKLKKVDDVGYQSFSIVLHENCIVTFQEEENDWLLNLVERIKENDTLLREKDSDYLFYRIIDTVIDSYYIQMEDIGDRIESLEMNIDIKKVKDSDLQEIQHIKKELVLFRKIIFPLREAISFLIKGENQLSEKSKNYLSDTYENSIHILETIELYRDLTSNLMDLYLTGINSRMNEVMKLLTIIATIFIPLTFITGIYGMNFEHMPELGFRYGYPIIWMVMITVVISMVVYFKRKKWW